MFSALHRIWRCLIERNINENVSVNKERENHREYNKTRKYNSRNRKPGDNNTKKPMGKQKNFRYKQQKTNSRHYEKHSDRQEIAAAGEVAAVQQPKAVTKPFSRNNKTQQPRGNARRGRKGTSKLKIIPLGGLEQIGMNITAFEYEDSIVVVDCGLAFPEDDMLGIDLVIPDVTYLKENISKVKGFVITHGHEDHIGALPYILKEVNVPVYSTKLTLGLITNKLKEHNLVRSTKLKEVKHGQVINLGDFSIEFIKQIIVSRMLLHSQFIHLQELLSIQVTLRWIIHRYLVMRSICSVLPRSVRKVYLH